MINKKPNIPWYSEEAGFFGKYYLETYSGMLTYEATKEEVSFLEKILNLKKGMRILDLACGHGRHSVELARRGYKVIGQDLNSFFLQKAKKAAKKARVSIEWVNNDMRDIPFESEFDVVVNLFTAFGYLEDEREDQKVLSQVARALKRGGKFVLDIINRERLMRVHQSRDWKEFPDGSIELYERSYDFATGYHPERRIRIWKNNKREERVLTLRLYTLVELIAMCKNTGLQFKEAYGNFNGEPLGLDSKRCIIIAEKK